jgi:hypothetical protein
LRNKNLKPCFKFSFGGSDQVIPLQSVGSSPIAAANSADVVSTDFNFLLGSYVTSEVLKKFNIDFSKAKRANVKLNKKDSSIKLLTFKEIVSSLVQASVTKAKEQVRVVLTCLFDLGMENGPSESHQNQLIEKLTLLSLADLSEGYLKHKLTCIAAVCLEQKELPPAPSWFPKDDKPLALLGGNTYRFVRRLIHTHDLFVANNFLQLKKGMPLGSETQKQKAVQKAVDALTTVHTTNACSIEEQLWLDDDDVRVIKVGDKYIDSSTEELVNQVRRSTKEFFRKGWYDPQKIYVPSISGHVLMARDGNGALGKIVKSRSEDSDQKFTFSPFDESQFFGDLHCTSFFINLCLMSEALEHEDWFYYDDSKDTITSEDLFHLIELREEVEDNLQCEELEMDSNITDVMFGLCTLNAREVIAYKVDHLEEVYQEGIFLEQYSFINKHNCVRPVGLLEPFKIRVITGGPEEKYYRSKYIQKSIHAHLRKFEAFRLIGEPISPDHFSTFPTLKDDEFYVSGDYSAATDNLDPRLSVACAETIAEQAGWSQSTKDLFIDTLVNHNFGYKKGEEEDETILKPQKWGQLMGSPTSFPVLCIVNFALTRYAQEQSQNTRIKGVKGSGILINGDDIGFITNDTGYEVWKKITNCGGLTPSIGKNYISRRFIVLNSTMYSVDQSCPPTFTHVPFINYGLVNCRDENGNQIEDYAQRMLPTVDPRAADIGSLACDLIKGHTPELQYKLLKRFMKAWKPALLKFCPRGMSYWLPRHLGGLGLPIIGEYKDNKGNDRFSRAQLCLAHYLDHSPENQARLNSTSKIIRSDSFKLWKMAQPKIEFALRNISTFYKREKQESVPLQMLTSNILALTYRGLTPEDLLGENFKKWKLANPEKDTPSNDEIKEYKILADENVYHYWRSHYERIFRESECSTYKPFLEEEVISSRPWYIHYNIQDGFDSTSRVDLRL